MAVKKLKFILLILLLVVLAVLVGLAGGNRVPTGYLPGWLERYLGSQTNQGGLQLQGNVEIREVRLAFEVPGRIARLHVEEGDRVEAGQLLAELEKDYFEDRRRQAQAALEAAQAELWKLRNGARPEEIEQAQANLQAAQVSFEHAQIQWERMRQLLPQKAVSQELYDNAKAARDRAEAQLQAAQAALKLLESGARLEEIARAEAQVALCQAQCQEAQRRLEDCRLLAPAAGLVQTRIREVGEWVNVGEPIYTLSLTDPVWIRTYVNGLDLERIRPGMAVTVQTDSGREYPGRIGFISPVAEFTPKTVQTREIRTNLVYRLRVIVSDPKGELRQGMPVSILVPAEGQ
ncbi:MAG: HlyD family efflux transporter periplasmic adaptor subunit [Thermoguttaceae bacterium]|nr:HlyD family efflux transporter periplasmic adaptor subunit [Thermoguttaceae bacterium]MDW8037004.1 HlyD family efflux transporter periplasmic adaptor subunit [Thermoguttaceae bacterium]